MTTYLNCEKPESTFGPVTCNTCGRTYKIEFDTIQAPYKETGILTCACGVDLIKWNSTTEPYLVKFENN